MQIAVTERSELLKRIRAAFSARDENYSKTRKMYDSICSRLQSEITQREKTYRVGESMTCSQQMLNEAVWLVHYTDKWRRVDRQIAKVKASLRKDQKHADRQANDGSWGACIHEWYRKLEPTVDELQKPGLDPKTIKRLRFLERLANTPTVMGHLWRRQITDIAATGINYRDELSAMQTALAQLLFKDRLHDLLEDHDLGFRFPRGFEAAFCDYLSQTQHPRTGYWGPWYLLEGELVIAHDLSFTFHVVNYRRGDIRNWPLVIDTTLAIKDGLYPYGWKPNENTKYSLHHCYDVVQIFSYGWPHMTWRQKRRARDELSAMLRWCLTEAINDRGAFKLRDDDVPIEIYYFGVRLLDAMGLWSMDKRFWYGGELPRFKGAPTPRDLCRSLAKAFAKFDQGSAKDNVVLQVLKTAIAETSDSRELRVSF
jgi:hypothetical protein